MMKYCIFFIMIYSGCLVFGFTCFAEFYKFRDSEGVLRFTDNLADVPENQRPTVDTYKEFVSNKSNAQPHLKNEIKAIEKEESFHESNSSNQQRQTQIQRLGNKISRIQESLQKEYQQLIEKKKALEALDKKSGPKKSTQVQYLKEQAKKLNHKIKAYHKKKETYIKTIQEYQHKIKLLSLKGSDNSDR